MSWQKLKVAEGAKLFKVHNFTYLFKGVTYHLSLDEFPDGTFVGHGEHSTDKNTVLESVRGTNLEDCLANLVKNVRG